MDLLCIMTSHLAVVVQVALETVLSSFPDTGPLLHRATLLGGLPAQSASPTRGFPFRRIMFLYEASIQ